MSFVFFLRMLLAFLVNKEDANVMWQQVIKTNEAIYVKYEMTYLCNLGNRVQHFFFLKRFDVDHEGWIKFGGFRLTII